MAIGNMKKITITFIGATLLSAASYATPQATVDISWSHANFQCVFSVFWLLE
jgi:hypothetical protein